MDVVSLAPVPVTSLRWRIGDGGSSLAIVCKLTFVLRPERAALAKRQEPIHGADLRTAEFPADRILAPSDCVPGRAAVDVTAFGPDPAALAAGRDVRLVIGTIDKRAPATPFALAGFATGSLERPGRAPEVGDDVLVPDGYDWSTFNAAPRDQRLHELAADAELRLENLHPEHATLTTRLPNVLPQVFVERGGVRREIPVRIDGLWIDARRGIACATCRAQLVLSHRDEPGKVFVAVAGPDRRLSVANLTELVAQLRGDGPASAKRPTSAAPPHDEAEDTLRTHRRREITETSLLGGIDDDATGEGLFAVDDAAPAWLKRDPSSAAQSALPPLASAPELPRTREPELTGPMPALTPPTAPAQPLAVPRPSPSGAKAPPSPTPSSPWSRALPDVEAPLGTPAVRVDLSEPAREVGRAIEPSKRVTRDVVELLWFDRDATAKLRRRYQAIADALEFEPLDPAHDLPSTDPEEARAHHAHFGLLTEVPTIGLAELRERVRESVSASGRFTPPVVALSGELSFPFDAVEQLRTTAAAMAPLVADDRKLAETLASVDELLASPLAAASLDAVQRLQELLRKVFRDVRRAVTLEQLDDIVTRSLLEKRAYQRRTLLGGVWIRSLFTTPGTRESIPCYLPEALASELPMMLGFRARLLGEAVVRVDQYETARHALRAFTLGRVLDL